MRCVKPFVSGRVAFGCGQCDPCRYNRRRTWAHRIMLEASEYKENAFVTLTYSEAKRDLDPPEVQRWLKRLRKKLDGHRIRYFVVGEYGDRSMRPHYHAALFGFPCCSALAPVVRGECQCRSCLYVRESWGSGHVMVGSLTAQSAHYIAGYVTKKMTVSTDVRLEGRVPEFARMSLQPGIGANAMWDVASAMMQFSQEATLPGMLKVGDRDLVIGRYLRLKLSRMLGQSDEERARLTDEALSRTYEAMSLVWRVAISEGVGPREILRQVNTPYAEALAHKASKQRSGI